MARDVPGYEWASLSLDSEFLVEDEEPLGMDCKSVTVARDSGQQLVLTARGVGRGPRYDNLETGGTSRTLQVRLRTRHLSHVLAEGFVPSSTRVHDDYLARRHETVVSGHLNKLSRRIREGQVHVFVEWLQNAPSGVLWPRTTERRRYGSDERVRDDERVTRATGSELPGRSSDHVLLELNLPTLSRIRFGTVKADLVNNSPAVERPGFLQFEAGPDGIADERLRYSVRFALNFMFGCGLGLLGYSEFDRELNELQCTLFSGFSPGGGSLAQPILMDAQSLQYPDEDFCRNFVLAYLEHEKAFSLDRVVWLLRNAMDAPLDMAAGYSGAAFEVLRRSYYELPANEARRHKVPKKQWKPLSKAIRAVIAAHAPPPTDTSEAASALTAGLTALDDSLQHLNEVSGTKLSTQFLDDLGLAHGATEKAALLARNDAAHANELKPDDYATVYARSDALRTLASRALLAVLKQVPLGYVDYGSSGIDDFPIRPWSDPQQLRVLAKVGA